VTAGVSPPVSPPPEAVRAPAPSKRVSYWSLALVQLRKNRVAMFGAWMVKGLVAVAVFAPLLASNVPLVLSSSEGLRLPVLDTLFDRFVYQGGVDVFFNLLLVVLPFWWVAARWPDAASRRAEAEGIRRWPGSLGRMVLVAGTLVLLGATYVVAAAGGAAYAGWAAAGVALPGVAAILAKRVTGRPRPRLLVLATTLLFVAGFVVVLAKPSTRALVDYRERAEAARAEGGFAVFPPIPHHPDNTGEQGSRSIARSLAPPSVHPPLGCDVNGRDVVARLLFGTRISLTIGIVAVAIFVTIGTVLGSLAGYYRGKVDLVVSRLVEVMVCFPTLFLLLTIVAVFETRSIFLIMGAIGFTGWTGVARLVRGEFLRQRGLDYVVAARSQGVPERRVIFGHVLPNCLGPVLVAATFGIAGAILAESTLAFLGLGDTRAASWGQMLTSGRETGKWHLILAPGLCIFFVLTVFNLLAEGLRDALDPKLRR
jgi:peptide/nickel transport system permease protein